MPASEKPEPVYGIAPDLLDLFSDITTNPEEFVSGGYSDIDCTIIGFSHNPGGEDRVRANTDAEDPANHYTTREALVMQVRADNWEELGLEDPYTTQNLTLPKAVVGSDGRVRRARPNQSSALAFFIETLAGLGVASVTEHASTYLFKDWSDLIGLQGHRVNSELPSINGSKFTVPVFHEIYGFDNELRKEQGLEPRYLKGQEPTVKTKATAAV